MKDKSNVEDVPHAGFISDESAWNPESDKIDKRKLKIICPSCERLSAPLCSNKTDLLHNSKVGIDWDEYHAIYKTQCRCGQHYRFAVISG